MHLRHTDWRIVLACAVLVCLYALFERYWRLYRQARASTWAVVTGQVLEATTFEDKYETTLTLRYSYHVPDEPEPVLSEFQKQFYDVTEAERWADALCDKFIPVRVNPRNPWRSQLWDSELKGIVASVVPQKDGAG